MAQDFILLAIYLSDCPYNKKVLALWDSQAAISALKKAGRTGRARTGDLLRTMELIRVRQADLGPNAVGLEWGKAHVGIKGKGEADQLAKTGTESERTGGLKHPWKRKREERRRVKGAGMGRVIKWSQKTRVNYARK